MFEDSPCGCFVLWRPGATDPSAVGVPFLPGGWLPGKDTLWLVDGQQRSRTLTGVLAEIVSFEVGCGRIGAPAFLPDATLKLLQELAPWAVSDAGDPSDEEDADACVRQAEEPEGGLAGGRHPSWFVCMPAIRALVEPRGGAEFDGWAESKNVQRFSMFRTFRDSALDSSRQPLPKGLVPLGALLLDGLPFSDLEATRRRLNRAGPGDVEWLDAHVPWGPLFLTGRAWQEGKRFGWASVGTAEPLLTMLQRPAWARVRRQFLEMFAGKRVAVGEIPGTSADDAIAAYVRINRAGVRVQAEERALAVLSRWHGEILKQLAEFIGRRDGRAGASDARALLTHAAEKSFGFSMWMRTVARYTVLRLFAKTGRQWLKPEDVERWTVSYRFETWSAPREGLEHPGVVIRGAADHASEALLLVDALLSDELGFDHRMARPDSRSMIPLLEVLAHVPPDAIADLHEDRAKRGALARVLHWTMLHRYLDEAELQGLCDAIHGGAKDGVWTFGGEAYSLQSMLERYMTGLDDLWASEQRRRTVAQMHLDGLGVAGRLRERAKDAFGALVEESRSLQHPAVGWLYAIERRGGAMEFDWKVQFDGHDENEGLGRLPTDATAKALCAAFESDGHEWHPEKQHIVPFSVAARIAGKGGTRATASPANDIGNLTWLSSRQNGFEFGLSDRWVVLSSEKDRANLAARGFLDSSDGEPAKALYEGLRRGCEAVDRKELKSQLETFERFCIARRGWMKRQMNAWLSEPLPGEAEALLGLRQGLAHG